MLTLRTEPFSCMVSAIFYVSHVITIATTIFIQTRGYKLVLLRSSRQKLFWMKEILILGNSPFSMMELGHFLNELSTTA